MFDIEVFQAVKLRFLKAPNGESVVIATDLIEALKGNKNNSSEIVKNNVRAKWWIDLPNPNGGHKIRCLFEPGVYQLAGNPMFQTELAESLQDYMFEVVFPKIRASGGYIMPTATSDEVQALVAEYKEENLRLSADNQVLTTKVEELQTTQEELIDTSYQLMVTTIKINSVISEWSIDLVPGLRKGLKPHLTKDDMRSLLAKLTSGVNRLLSVDDWVRAISACHILPSTLEIEEGHHERKKRIFDDFILQLTERRLENL
jgi:prophage antirepressor-like protein